VVRGPVRGSMEKILSGYEGVINTCPTYPDDISIPSREKYYYDIPRMANRYRKVMISMFGCPWNCHYCASSSGYVGKIYGRDVHKKFFLSRRSISTLIKEAKDIKSLGRTDEIEWVDDDIFTGKESNEWLLNFIDEWSEKIDIPMYVSTSSHSALNISDEVLFKMRKIVNCIGMGVQASRPSSLKIFNRQWDNEVKMKKAYDRLVSFGYSVNLQAIIGLPIKDPVEDAIETLNLLRRIGPGSICSIYPLQIYHGTKMEKYCFDNNFRINELCGGDTNSGVANLLFSEKEMKLLRNICKLGTFFVKYDINEKWIRALIDVDFNDEVSKKISMTRYHECVIDRLGNKGEEVFKNIVETTKLRY